ncbi:hypothetical protein Drorol1_Dr00013108 [Drosera rotundifolia]
MSKATQNFSPKTEQDKLVNQLISRPHFISQFISHHSLSPYKNSLPSSKYQTSTTRGRETRRPKSGKQNHLKSPRFLLCLLTVCPVASFNINEVLQESEEIMYAEAGILNPYYQNFTHELQQFQELCLSHKPTSSMSNLIQTSTITEYDLGGDGDLFKAPEPIIEEPMISIDPVAAAISLMSCGDDIMPGEEALKVADMEGLQSVQLLSDIFYECKKDMLEKTSSVEDAFLQVSDTKLPPLPEESEMIQAEDSKLPAEFSFQKSVSSGCLTAMEWVNPPSIRPNFLDFSELNFGAAYGMRRSLSDGDIKTLGNGNISLIHSPIQRPLVIGSCTSEDRLQKLSRYRNKKARRNFGRKIKYACRKALADSQPRIRGRFARTEETEVCRKA